MSNQTEEWQPIDYSQSESGQAPFDGGGYLVCGDASCAVVSWRHGCFAFHTGDGVLFLDRDKVTHWMPVPEFMKGTS